MHQDAGVLRIALGGDVMLGRGIDQVLPHPSDPRLHERYISSALDYVALAERANGAIPRPVSFSYLWGDALAAAAPRHADLRIINLETAVTRVGEPAPKGINYRMHPDNLPCLAAFGVDCCVLANNHVLDWGEAGLLETIEVLAAAGLQTAGAGRNAAEAWAPAVLGAPGGRVLVFAAALASSGVPLQWAAGSRRPGIALLEEMSSQAVSDMATRIDHHRQKRDIVVVSLHWGANWGYAVSDPERAFAQALIDRAKVDVLHGHSSHHPKGIEIHRGKAIFYGCGDLINDYEGISGYESYRGDLSLLYLVTLGGKQRACQAVEMLPFRIRRFRLEAADAEATSWLLQCMDRECGYLGSRVIRQDGHLLLAWPPQESSEDGPQSPHR